MLRPSWGATALAFHGAPARLPSPLPINKAARNAERFRAAGWTNHAPDKVHGKRDRLRSHDRLLWNWIKLLGFDGAYTAGVGRFDDGRLAEVFLNADKVGTAIETQARDAAITASLFFQNGGAPET
jgi:hypothetical protein